MDNVFNDLQITGWNQVENQVENQVDNKINDLQITGWNQVDRVEAGWSIILSLLWRV